MKKLAKVSLLVLLSLTIALAGTIYLTVGRHWFDNALLISDKYETIEVTPMRWACDCADWLETRYLPRNPDEQVDDKKCIFIEAAPGHKQVPDSYHLRRVRLTGRFYIDKGISRNYSLNGDTAPDHARVFRYDSFVILESRPIQRADESQQ